MKFFFIGLFQFFYCINFCFSQGILNAEQSLSAEEFVGAIKKFHPIIKQADIGIKMASANLTVARAGFDPSFYIESDQKTFDGKNYYQYTNPELKIPTWYGIEVKAGLENNSGQFLLSESTVGQSSYLGITMPLAKNLLMDKRRAMLKQAKIFQTQSTIERINIINDLLYDGYTSYWNWVKEYESYAVISATVKVNEARFDLTKIGYRQGDRPAIDTVEALAQLQNFQFLQNESLVKVKNAGVELSNFLWLQNNTYYQLPETVKPNQNWSNQLIDTSTMPLLENLLYTAKLTHPKLQLYNYKLQVQEIERRLKFQSLLPTVNVKANLLNRGNNVFKGVNAAFFENNNKFGIDIGLPLRLSEGRGGYKLAKLKIQETNFELLMKQQEVENKVKYYFNEQMGLKAQVKIFEAAYKNYQTIFRGEDARFKAGESSLFLLNTRENKLLETAQKLIELKTKFYKSQVALQWAAGQLK